MADDSSRFYPLRPYSRQPHPELHTKSLAYGGSVYKGNDAFKQMVQKAEQAMTDYQLKD